MGRYDEAVKVAQEALAIGDATQGPNAPNTLQAKNLLGYAHECQERWQEAEPLLVEVLEQRKSTLPSNSIDVQRSLGFVARIYAKQQKWEIASKFLAELMIAQHPEEYPDADALTKHLTFVLTSAELKPDDVEL